MDESLRLEVRTRSSGFCEYCKIPEAFDRMPFQVDHIIAEKHRGATVTSNLAWSCYDCNIFKGPNVAGVDPATDEIVQLFNPRDQHWAEHFQLVAGMIQGRTKIGRTTVETLRFNLDRRLALRIQLIDEGVFPNF